VIVSCKEPFAGIDAGGSARFPTPFCHGVRLPFSPRVALETLSTPISVAIVVQVNQDVRQYVPLIARTGSVFDALLVGESGEAAVITYNGDIIVAKPFGEGDVQSALGKISAHGRRARMIDAGFRAIALLKERPTSRDRILLFIGQPG